MNDISGTSNNKRNILLRGLFMLLMLMMLHVRGTVLGVVTVIQFVIALVNGSPNERLIILGQNLGSYLRQVACFLAFATEEVPFPFSDWPED